MAENEKEIILKVKNLNFKYEDEYILKNINFEVIKGEVIIIVGPRGEGKSTLLKVIAGLIPFDEGEVFYRDIDLKQALKSDMLRFHKKTSFVFQDSALISNMKIFDNVALPLRYHEILPEEEIVKKVNELIDYVELANVKNLLPAYVSMGQKKLISLIRATITEPETIFYDEPIANLDIRAQNKVIKTITSLKNKNITSIIITHEFTQFESITDRVIVLKDRQIYKIGTLEELKLLNDNYITNLISN